MGEGRQGVRHAHIYASLLSEYMRLTTHFLRRTLEFAPWANAHSRLLLTDGTTHGINHLQSESTPVLDRAPVLVGALVRHLLNELVNEISMGAVDLDAIKARFVDSISRRFGERFDMRFNFYSRIQVSTSIVSSGEKLTWYGKWARNVGSSGERHVRRRNVWEIGLLLAKLRYPGSAPQRPDLHIDERPFSVHGIRNLSLVDYNQRSVPIRCEDLRVSKN